MDTYNPGELIHDTCPVCGEVRTGYSNINLMLCRNDNCPVQFYLIPKGIKTRIEAMAYAGWLPDKDSAGRNLYFNPRLLWLSRHCESIRRDNELKSLKRNLTIGLIAMCTNINEARNVITGLVGMNNEA